jgi:ribosomal protein L32
MAVPKKRKTNSAKGQRRSHDALKPVQLVRTPDGGLAPRRLLKAIKLGLVKASK